MNVKKTGLTLSLPLFLALAVGVIALASIKPTREGVGAAEAQGNTNRPLAEALPITLRRGGFVPREITKPAGDYFISINNLSGVPELVLRFDRENGDRIHEERVPRQRPNWRQHVHLTPGTYTITEADHPDWVCRITITAR